MYDRTNVTCERDKTTRDDSEERDARNSLTALTGPSGKKLDGGEQNNINKSSDERQSNIIHTSNGQLIAIMTQNAETNKREKQIAANKTAGPLSLDLDEDGSRNGQMDLCVEKNGNNKREKDQKPPNIADIIGEFGIYQLSLTLITLIRYVCVAMMTNTGPLLAPALTYYCQFPLAQQQHSSSNLINASFTNDTHTGASMSTLLAANRANLSTFSTSADFLKNECQLELANATTYKCTQWTYETTNGPTLTDTFDLICDRNWLRSAFQSSVSIGVTIASVLFGSFSDEHGRRLTTLACSAISLLAGLVSWWAPNFLVYTLARSICSMCDLGLVSSLYTTIVETLGQKYRGAICLIVFTGWSLGVMIMPWITSYFLDFRRVMLFTVICHLLTIPWLLTIGESIRWLLVRGQLIEARREVHRICKWNLCANREQLAKVDKKFDLLKVKFELLAREKELKISLAAREFEEKTGKRIDYNSRAQIIKRTLFGGLSKVGQIFKSRELTITTATIIWTIFNSELLYMLFIMINSDVGDNVKLNYAIGGLVETLATLISIVMVSCLARRVSLSSTLIVICVSMFCLAFTHNRATVSVWTLNFTKLAISTLSSLVYVINTELFPTSLRQTGMGLTGTMGSMGAIVAPFVRTELVDMIGMTSVMLLLGLLPLSAALIIPFFLRETRGIELADNLDDISNDHHDDDNKIDGLRGAN